MDYRSFIYFVGEILWKKLQDEIIINQTCKALSKMMRIIGGAIGQVFTTAILTLVKILITVDNAKKCYPSVGCNSNCECVPSSHN